MYIFDLSLSDLRSYHSLVLSLEPGSNTFVGSSGQGETSLVKAITYLATLSPHRIGANAALVRRAAPGQAQPAGAVMHAWAVHGEKPSILEIEIIAGETDRARLDRGGCRLRDLLGVLRAVVSVPEDLSLVRAEPEVRRSFLGDLIITLRLGLARIRAEYDKILAQRVGPLKSARATRSSVSSMPPTLEVWDVQPTAAAARPIVARVDVVRRLRPWVASTYRTISGTSRQRPRAQLAYRSSLLTHEGHPGPDSHDESAWLAGEETLFDEAALAARLESAMGELHARKIDRGTSLAGAHRDNLSLFLTGLPACGFASYGEQWSLALTLRLASYDIPYTDIDAYGRGGEPVLILDDVFISLSEQRRRILAQMVAGAQQVLLTTAVDDDVPAELSGARYRVADDGVTCD